MEKVGRTTGRTYGTITNTCVDKIISNSAIAIRCANRVGMWAGGGDSGSPVYMPNDVNDPTNNAVTLMGTVSGVETNGTTYYGEPTGNVTYYTSFSSFKQELGTGNGVLNTLTTNMMDPVTLDVTLGSNAFTLNWNAATAGTLTTPTQYRVYYEQTWLQYTQDGYLEPYSNGKSLEFTTSDTSHYFTPSNFTSTSCALNDVYTVVVRYSIVAWNQGISTPFSNDICLQ